MREDRWEKIFINRERNVYIYIYIYREICTYIYMYIYIYIYIYINSHYVLHKLLLLFRGGVKPE